jgi:hypothetical protein
LLVASGCRLDGQPIWNTGCTVARGCHGTLQRVRRPVHATRHLVSGCVAAQGASAQICLRASRCRRWHDQRGFPPPCGEGGAKRRVGG